MKIIKLTDQMIRVHFKTQRELAETFIRFQEYYESPEWKNKIFTLGQYREWYSRETGAFTYYSDWNGFNIPSEVLIPFRCGLFDPLTDLEKQFLELIPARTEKFYIIGTHAERGDKEDDTLTHEICHGLYYTNDTYRKEVNMLLGVCYDALQPLRDKLLSTLGYHNDVIDDECHAYVSASNKWLDEKKIPYPKKLHEDLKHLRERLYEKA